jgi:hypothetical protein
MARPCSVCSHTSRAEIDRELGGLRPVADVARMFEIGESSLRRHARNHLSGSLLVAASLEDGPQVSDYASALSLALSDVMAVRRAALAAGQAATVLRAAATTERLVSTMGVDDEEVVRQLRDGERLALAVGQTARRHPEFAVALRDHLAASGEHELAEAMNSLAAAPRTHTPEEN